LLKSDMSSIRPAIRHLFAEYSIPKNGELFIKIFLE